MALIGRDVTAAPAATAADRVTTRSMTVSGAYDDTRRRPSVCRNHTASVVAVHSCRREFAAFAGPLRAMDAPQSSMGISLTPPTAAAAVASCCAYLNVSDP